MTKVNKKLAAKMVDVGRTTFYRHIEEKGISVDADNKIDVSELIRVYGNDKVKTPEQLKQSSKVSEGHVGTVEDSNLAAEVKRLKAELENQGLERKRERDQFSDEIDHLKKLLDKSMDQNNSLTRLLTDERASGERTALQKETEQEEKLETVLKAVRSLEERQRQHWWSFGRKKSI